MNDIILFAVIVLIYGLLESLWNVALFRPSMTWAPLWDVVKTLKKTKSAEIKYSDNAYGFELSGSILDPFHTIKATLTLFVLSYIFQTIFQVGWWILAVPFGVWAIYYLAVFPWLYHEFWMEKSHRDLHTQSIVWKYIYFWRM